jgi:hypothetical protein
MPQLTIDLYKKHVRWRAKLLKTNTVNYNVSNIRGNCIKQSNGICQCRSLIRKLQIDSTIWKIQFERRRFVGKLAAKRWSSPCIFQLVVSLYQLAFSQKRSQCILGSFGGTEYMVTGVKYVKGWKYRYLLSNINFLDDQKWNLLFTLNF